MLSLVLSIYHLYSNCTQQCVVNIHQHINSQLIYVALSLSLKKKVMHTCFFDGPGESITNSSAKVIENYVSKPTREVYSAHILTPASATQCVPVGVLHEIS